MTGELEDRVAIVTGGGGGIGAAIVRRYAEAGARVAVLDLDVGAARSVSEATRGAEAFGLDVADVEAHHAVLDAVEDRMGPASVLVNNAGVGTHADVLDVTPEQWDRVHSVNARGTFFFMQEFARRLVAAGTGGSIINVTSVVADRVWLPSTAYAASKAVVRTFTEYAAAELGRHGIRVNNLCPGPTDTPLSAPRYSDPGFRASLLEAIPLRRIGSTRDLADAALFLASDTSAFTTGTTLYVDGGRHL
ncbi:glucose 1-dehydrogenase [Okibacterium endophyticum]